MKKKGGNEGEEGTKMDTDAEKGEANGKVLKEAEGEQNGVGAGEVQAVEEIGIVIHDED